MKVIDLTHTIQEEMPVFPGTEPPALMRAASCEEDGFREMLLKLTTHTGTHMDSPAHIFPDGITLDQFPADQFMGRALVIDCRALKAGEAITMKQLLRYGEKVEQADFLLFYSGWDQYWGTSRYFGEYPCVDDEVLDYIIKGTYKGIGFDVMGLDPIRDENLPWHKRLFQGRDMINMENLKNLGLCGHDLFWFFCFPMKIRNSDGAPVRAVACVEEEG